MFVPELINGKKYYFRMSRIKHNNYLTGWSEEHSDVRWTQLPANQIYRE
jgi:hypothetical protein